MTTADVAPIRVAGDVLDPLGIRELLDDQLFVGSVGFDLGARPLADLDLTVDSVPFGCTLVIVDPLPKGHRSPIASHPCPADLAVALRLRPGGDLDPSDRDVVDRVVGETLARHGVDAFDTVIFDGVDPFVHPAVVADTAWSLLDRGFTRSVSLAAHRTGQARAAIEHLGSATRPAAVGVDLAEVTTAALIDGPLDLCMEVGSLPLVPLTPALGAAADVQRLSALLHHPSRPVLVVDPDDLAGRMQAVEAARVPLDRTEIRRLLAEPSAPSTTESD